MAKKSTTRGSRCKIGVVALLGVALVGCGGGSDQAHTGAVDGFIFVPSRQQEPVPMGTSVVALNSDTEEELGRTEVRQGGQFRIAPLPLQDNILIRATVPAGAGTVPAAKPERQIGAVVTLTLEEPKKEALLDEVSTLVWKVAIPLQRRTRLHASESQLQEVFAGARVVLTAAVTLDPSLDLTVEAARLESDRLPRLAEAVLSDALGRLTVQGREGLTILINGHNTGQTTPHTFSEVLAGKLNVALTGPLMTTRPLTTTINTGEETVVQF